MDANMLDDSVDKSKIPPLHQKRVLAFINHFVTSSCSFLNDFASKCEVKFIEIERKIQKAEASLEIIEAKLSSIPDANDPKATTEPTTTSQQENLEEKRTEVEQVSTPGIKASEDIRYKKYFKMLQFGVPIGAVKMKVSAEGLNPDILDMPDLIMPDGRLS